MKYQSGNHAHEHPKKDEKNLLLNCKHEHQKKDKKVLHIQKHPNLAFSRYVGSGKNITFDVCSIFGGKFRAELSEHNVENKKVEHFDFIQRGIKENRKE